MNYTLDVTNTAVVEPTTTTSTTTTTTTTIPVSVSPEDVAATPGGTIAPRPPTQPVPPAAIADPVPATNLAQTGSDTSSTVLAGLGLLLAGLVVVGATRRSAPPGRLTADTPNPEHHVRGTGCVQQPVPACRSRGDRRAVAAQGTSARVSRLDHRHAVKLIAAFEARGAL